MNKKSHRLNNWTQLNVKLLQCLQVKPLLQVTNQEAAIALKEEELKAVKDKLSKRETEYADVEKRLKQLSEERNVLQEQLQQVSHCFWECLVIIISH